MLLSDAYQSYWSNYYVAGYLGFEPRTTRLTVESSTAELIPNLKSIFWNFTSLLVYMYLSVKSQYELLTLIDFVESRDSNSVRWIPALTRPLLELQLCYNCCINLLCYFHWLGNVSLEPTFFSCLEQMERIELSSPDWKSGVMTIIRHLLICYSNMSKNVCFNLYM